MRKWVSNLISSLFNYKENSSIRRILVALNNKLCQAQAQVGKHAEAIPEQVKLILSYEDLSSIEVVFPLGCLPSFQKIGN